ncbi:hypothetical protein pEaSNUABM55_00219 [Erwinia phage pEa_SNUABM_55]|nr:hypothetical protein pEaSNUABM55_00219 [Erwinia phage pEa_SNUABM_55]
MQNYDLHGVRSPHWDYRHRETLHDLPDMEGFMKDKVKDIMWELDRVDTDDSTTESRLDSAKSLVSDLLSDVPNELKDFTAQNELKDSMVADMTYAALSVTRSIDQALDEFDGQSPPPIDKIKEILLQARSECDDIFTTSSQRLHDVLLQFGWSDTSRGYLRTLLGVDYNPFMTVDSGLSTSPSDLTMSVDGWLIFDGGSDLDMFVGGFAISVSTNGTILIKESAEGTVHVTTHKIQDLMSIFDDYTNPTRAELAVYTMSTDKVWDILAWHNLLKSKLK